MDNQAEIDAQQDSAQENLKEAGQNVADAVKDTGGAVVDQAEEVAEK